MNSTNIINTVNGIIDTLSKKLGVAADKIYPVLLQQAKVDVIQNILLIAFMLGLIVIAIIYIKWANKNYKDSNSYGSEDTIMYTSWWIGGIISLICLIIIICSISAIIQISINPNYYIFSQYIQPLIK